MTEKVRRERRGRAAIAGALAVGAVATAAVMSLPLPSAAAAAQHVVSYHGYSIRVPASWPVYHLASDPARCVLFNRHAIYLGTPGANQACPARAYGRTEAILIQPGTGGARALPSAVKLPASTAALPASAAALPAAAARQASTSHLIQVEAPGPGVTVTATYGANQSLIRSILAGATKAAGAGTTTQASTSTQASSVSGSSPPAAATAAGTAAGSTAGDATTADLAGVTGSGLGFDACTAPSQTTMTDWLSSPYRVIGTYLGGANWACSYGNFTAGWVQQVASEGWQFIPIWVGEQASCSTIRGAQLINPADAAAEGAAEAADAVATAQSFGYGTGTTLYFDMEGYARGGTCSQGVLTFLSSWTQGLHAAGYLSGVYSSGASGIADLAANYSSTTYTRPDDVWVADWDANPQAQTDPFLPAGDWANGQRLRQYAGGHNETWGGVTINIDSDAINGPVASLPGVSLDPGPALLAGPDALATAPGVPAAVTFTVQGGRPAAPGGETWTASPPAGITATPAGGSVAVSAGQPASVDLTLTPDAGLAAGRYEVPVTIADDGVTIAETFELVSVTQPGTTLSTAPQIVLYAADTASMAAAEDEAARLALPAADVTGTFTTAWTDLTGGKDVLIAVGQAADNALFYNTCGWANPAGEGAGSTPFFFVTNPSRTSPGADAYEPANGTTDASSAMKAAQFAHYMLTGTLPDYERPPALVPSPARTCLGSASIPASPPAPTVTGVSVAPSAATVQRGATQSFSATVTGLYNPAQTVTWSVSGNNSAGTTISASGQLTVASDETAPAITVTAASSVDGSKSAAVSVAVPQPPAALTPPSISGTAAVGNLLFADPGTWDVAGVTLAYQWLANGTPIAGATSPDLLVSGDLNGASIAVTVTASAPGRPDGSATSDAVAISTIPTWDAGTIYHKGDIVLYQGKVYQAQWYAKVPVPGASPYGPWAEQGVQVATSQGVVRTWTASWNYTGGETVAWDGHLWQANWWNRNQEPSDTNVAWQDLGT